jgi:carboxymethylenebutenolidase
MQAQITRRGLIVGSAAVAGYALAVRPVNAQAITTPSTGLDEGEVQIPAGDLQMFGYRARPKGVKNAPVVLVVHEIFGVHEYIRDVCRRFAAAGYLAIAPNLYQRQGDVSGLSDFEEILAIVNKVPDAQVFADLDATVTWAQQSGEGDTSRLGITGFCWGGRIVWLYSEYSPAPKAGVAWYGRLVQREGAPAARTPLAAAASLKAPVLGLYGEKDDGIPLDTVEQMRAALEKAGSPSQIVVYPDAPHGFHADYRPSYRAKDAADGWQHALDWFGKHGVSA